MLSALPVINLANCCCAWILFGGALAAYLMQQNHPEPITIGDGAIVGLLAGVVGAFVWLMLFDADRRSLMAPFQSAMIAADAEQRQRPAAGDARDARGHCVERRRRSASASSSFSS